MDSETLIFDSDNEEVESHEMYLLRDKDGEREWVCPFCPHRLLIGQGFARTLSPGKDVLHYGSSGLGMQMGTTKMRHNWSSEDKYAEG